MKTEVIRIGEMTISKEIVRRKGIEYLPARQRTKLTPGDAIRIMRKLNGWTQQDLADMAGVSVQSVSTLERNRAPLGRKRALRLSQAFGIHPGILMFPEYVATKKFD